LISTVTQGAAAIPASRCGPLRRRERDVSTGRSVGAIAPGRRADLVVIDEAAPAMYGPRAASAIDAFVFAGDVPPVSETWVGGRRVVAAGRPTAREAVVRDLWAAMDRILNSL